MAGVNAFRSRGDAEKVKLGLERKHQAGGSHGPARLGYLNVRETVADRQVAAIALDPDRAPLVRALFDLAATGEHTLSSLTDLICAAGLTNRATLARPSRPITRSSVHRILRDDYYTGVVTRNGAKLPGRHDAVVDNAIFERVQAILDAHRAGGERSQKHTHYLNGTLYCGHCGTRLGYGRHRGRLGTHYEYYSCLSRVRPSGPCGAPYAPIGKTEAAVARLHSRPWLNSQDREALRKTLRTFVGDKVKNAEREAARHERRLRELTGQQQKLVQLYYRDAISIEVLQAEQDRIAQERAKAERWQSQAIAQVEGTMEALDEALVLISNPRKVYAEAEPSLRKILNRAVFERIDIHVEDDRAEAEGQPHEIYPALLQAASKLGCTSAVPEAVRLDATQWKRMQRNEPKLRKTEPGFARRKNGGEGGIRTLDTVLSRILP